MRKIIHRIKRNSGTIAAVFAIFGVCYTAYRGIKDGTKLDTTEFQAQSTSEKAKIILKNCYPTIISAVATSALIIASDCRHRKLEASLAGVAASAAHNINKNNINRDIPDKPANTDKVLFYESFSKQFFESTFADVSDAEYELNRLFILKGDATMKDFLDMLGIPSVPSADKYGWGEYIGEVKYGYRWVDFVHAMKKDGDRTYYAIYYPFDPTRDYLGDDDFE